ncbi:MAG: hypothetical protein KGY45_05155 [Hadesarchaea archaeon]|nr:hypothetical protein [Hadesarchaea archaeon]
MKRKSTNTEIPIYHENCILRGSGDFGNLTEIDQEKIESVQPCGSEENKIMVEINLPTRKDELFLSPSVLCKILENYKNQSACSENLGMGRVMWRDHRIYIYKHGKFDIRFATSEDDAIKTMNSISRLVLGSVFCEHCGQPALECALGRCGKCLAGNHLKSSEFFNAFNEPILEDGFGLVIGVLRQLINLVSENENQQIPFESQITEIRDKIHEGIELFLDFLLKSSSWIKIVSSIDLISLSLELVVTLEKIMELERVVKEKSEIWENVFGKINRFIKMILENFVSILNIFYGNSIQALENIKENEVGLQELVSFFEKSEEDVFNNLVTIYERTSLNWKGFLEVYS